MPSRQRLAAAMGATAVAALPSSVVASTYIVHPGDTLWDIAVRHGTTAAALAAANHLADPSLLRIGQLLEIPDSSIGLPAYTRGARDVEVHRVTAGETVLSIARRFGLDPTALARTNGLNVNSPLGAGVTLHVPGRLARINALLVSIAHQVGVDPAVVKAVAWMESGWQQTAVSATGAVGIMQIEPYTGEWVSRYLADRPLKLGTAADNVRAGTLLLHHLIELHGGNVDAALAAYYQGDSSIRKHGLYDDTRRYVAVVRDLAAAG